MVGLVQLQVWTLWAGLGSLLCKSSPPSGSPHVCWAPQVSRAQEPLGHLCSALPQH